jgi:hypothetical protein
MTVVALRKELISCIETLPEKKLKVLKPLLTEYAKPLYIIEPATPAEAKRAEKRIKEYHKDPSSFVPFKKRV